MGQLTEGGGASPSDKISINLTAIEKQRQDLKDIHKNIRLALDNLDKTFGKLEDRMKGEASDNIQDYVANIRQDIITPAYEYNDKVIVMLNAVEATYSEEALQVL